MVLFWGEVFHIFIVFLTIYIIFVIFGFMLKVLTGGNQHDETDSDKIIERRNLGDRF